jgi:hypothetical protein
MPPKFTDLAQTCVWLMKDQFRVEHGCRVKTEDMLTAIDVHFLPLNAKDSELGADILHALQNVRVLTFEEIDAILEKRQEIVPRDYNKYWRRYHSVHLTFDPKEETRIKIDGRAAVLNKPNRVHIPSNSRKADVGAVVRAMFSRLEAQALPKRSSPRAKKS